MRTVTVHEAKTYLACFLDQVAAGEEVIITKAGQPIARLMPEDRSEPRAPGIAMVKTNVYVRRSRRGLMNDQKNPRTEPRYRAFSSRATRLVMSAR